MLLAAPQILAVRQILGGTPPGARMQEAESIENARAILERAVRFDLSRVDLTMKREPGQAAPPGGAASSHLSVITRRLGIRNRPPLRATAVDCSGVGLLPANAGLRA